MCCTVARHKTFFLRFYKSFCQIFIVLGILTQILSLLARDLLNIFFSFPAESINLYLISSILLCLERVFKV